MSAKLAELPRMATVTYLHGHERWLDKRQLAEVLGVSESWINKRMREDGLPFRRRGRCMYRLTDVLEWEERRQAARALHGSHERDA